MNAGPRNGSTARMPRRSPDKAASAALMNRASPGAALSAMTQCIAPAPG